MANDKVITQHHKTFENIRQLDDKKNEFWLSRQLSEVLEYSEYRHFLPVIDKAKNACKNSSFLIKDHFEDVRGMLDIGSGARREISDIKLSRYACYLIVQNADPSKPVIAIGQTYFAIQTRRQEVNELKKAEHVENAQRLMLREELASHNKSLVAAAKDAGVETNLDYAIFQDEGYKGLYGGLRAQDIHDNKKLKKSHKILDHMGSTELAANLFRSTQTEEKLRRDKIVGKQSANHTHHEVGKKIRQTIKELGGIMPEHLPTPEKSIQQLEHARKKTEELE